MRKLLLLLTLSGFVGFTIANTQTTHHKHKHHTTAKKHTVVKKKHTTTTTSNSVKGKHKKKHKSRRHLQTVAAPTIANFNSDSTTTQTTSNNKLPIEFVDQKSVSRQPKLYSYSAIAVNANTGEVIASKNPNARLPIASITKLMTAMVLLDSGANLNDYVTISNADIDTLRNTYSRLKVGMQFRRKDLLLLALMSSENRAAHAIGRTTFKGGTSVFIRKMNEKALALGMTNTKFYDSTGLTNQNQSTATDVSKMVQDAYTYDDIKKYTTTKNADVMFGPKYVHRYINSDALVRADKFQIEVSKTGFINEAGHCLALYSIVNNKPIVMVFLNSTGKSGRLLDAMAIKNYVENRT